MFGGVGKHNPKKYNPKHTKQNAELEFMVFNSDWADSSMAAAHREKVRGV